ncbi:MAG: DNA polymerase III subunit delta' [Oscillatoriales cyanobacterium]|uniref:DNA polymerase III subunit delta n=1 Tax=Microcoleus anatoxicus PTRS2 TaxID=2705321 RepID=A0ABU8YNS8_9CYAN|nr:MAG: DNA polymerase III subunit delta' [Oscillatoriales cyanobacterium]TAD96977.1 MAG: DNA polymerase III subunit delta' [Oscillatoriales cyanobacterium]TAE04369.1 MAG: DNA polymerase III subunit delta' [Oscillatoriales cyanobacterium]TAF02759.1 MAG: DNA polymerase III subunit delta' [Oscillatoriales cyanobacterium]TAF65772.1 MAG: DNA polymerase III subunit delta' [Oscillatoriales cyanobacterium]
MDYFESLIGQNQAVELLTQAVGGNRIAPGYLFVGSNGIGKSLAARCFIELLFSANLTQPKLIASVQNRVRLGNHPDLLWVEPTYMNQGKRLSAQEAEEAGLKRKSPPQIRLEQVREIGDFLSRPPLESSRSIVVLSQAETMGEGAANGLLKTLEEPGKAALILMAPTVESLLPTLISRCQKIQFNRLNPAAMALVLQQRGFGEILSHAEVMGMAQGSPGEAIAIWRQLQSMPDDLLQKVKQLPQNLRSALELAKEIDKTLDTESQLWLIDYLQHCYWQQFLAGEISRSPLEPLEKARQYLLNYVQPRLVWECTLMGICQSL